MVAHSEHFEQWDHSERLVSACLDRPARAVIAITLSNRYDPTNTDGGRVVDDQATLERRLDAGEWLSPGEVAVLLGLGRTTVHGLLESGRIGFRLTTGGAKRQHRRCDPADVRRLLNERREVHRGNPIELMPPGGMKDAAREALRRHHAGEPPPMP